MCSAASEHLAEKLAFQQFRFSIVLPLVSAPGFCYDKDNKIIKIVYRVGNTIVAEDNEQQDFGSKTFDIAPYWKFMSFTDATTFSITATDLYGASAALEYSINAI